MCCCWRRVEEGRGLFGTECSPSQSAAAAVAAAAALFDAPHSNPLLLCDTLSSPGPSHSVGCEPHPGGWPRGDAEESGGGGGRRRTQTSEALINPVHKCMLPPSQSHITPASCAGWISAPAAVPRSENRSAATPTHPPSPTPTQLTVRKDPSHVLTRPSLQHDPKSEQAGQTMDAPGRRQEPGR